MHESENFNPEEEGRPKNEELVKLQYHVDQNSEGSPTPTTSVPIPRDGIDPGLSALVPAHDPLSSEGLRLFPSEESPIDRQYQSGVRMAYPPETDGKAIEDVTTDRPSAASVTTSTTASLAATTAGATNNDEGAGGSQQDTMSTGSSGRHLAMRARVDSGQDTVMHYADTAKVPRLSSPLKVHTTDSDAKKTALHEFEDSIATSPTLAKHTKTAAEGTGDDLAPYGPTSPSAASPERLPSIRQLTSTIPTPTTASLTELAEIATQATQDLRPRQPYAHQHRPSFGSIPPQSPIMPNHSYPNPAQQLSPQAYYGPGFNMRSPTSTISEHYPSPAGAYPAFGGFAHRRPSIASDYPAQMPSLPSASSSGESYGNVSSVDGYTTAHTTPIDSGAVSDCTMRQHPGPMLPPPPGMQMPLVAAMMIPGPYKCDVPECNAQAFQTQYLLSSHKNVHSQSRPHYCPVPECSRSEGGKGFKRKNEMIRHGLVHSSPGYSCPFCPEREHKYPRPDNLQRHVRVHHTEKDKDDPVLREVLAQRMEGQGKTRRRRTGGGVS